MIEHKGPRRAILRKELKKNGGQDFRKTNLKEGIFGRFLNLKGGVKENVYN